MTTQTFRGLVAEYEHSNREDPDRFAWTTAAMAVSGYAAIVGTLAASAWGLSWLAQQFAAGRVRGWMLMVGLGLLSLLLSLARALWMRSRSTPGLVVTAKEAPRLFELIEKVRRKTGAPRPDRVLIDGELNAAVVQRPRLGLLGWHRNELVLGLPLLLGLSPRQLGAVMAHEFGHLRGAHGKLGAWVYRTRRSWLTLAESRHRARIGSAAADFAIVLFFRHFFPRFNARAFVLSRQQEVEADRTAHRIAGAKASAEGLLTLAVQARWLDEVHWPQVWRGAVARASVADERPYRTMARAIAASLRDPQAPRWLDDAVRRLPDPADTHPSLRDRLELASMPPALPPPPEASAAAALFGSALDGWIDRMDARWRDENARAWGDLHRRANGQRHMIEELARERTDGRIEPDDHLLWARAAALLDGEAAGERVLREAVAARPGDHAVRHELARLLLDSHDAERRASGAALMRELAEAGPHPWADAAARDHLGWLEREGRTADAKAWRPRVEATEAQAQRAMEVLQDFDGPQYFEPAGLSRRTVRAMQDVLRGERAAGRAFVVGKTAQGAPGWRFCIVVVERSKVLNQPDKETWWAALRERFELPCPFMVVDLAHPYWADEARRPVVKQMLAVPNAQFHAARGA